MEPLKDNTKVLGLPQHRRVPVEPILSFGNLTFGSLKLKMGHRRMGWVGGQTADFCSSCTPNAGSIGECCDPLLLCK